MLLYIQRSGQSAAPYSSTGGVFEDDALLLRLALRSRPAERVRRDVAGCFGPDRPDIDDERPGDASAWDF